MKKLNQDLIAGKIAHLTNKYNLLSGNHFGVLKCKTTSDALAVL